METDGSNVSNKIKLKELETVFLNSQVLTPFCTSWSEDNKISIVVEGGVFIYELWPIPFCDQHTVNFSKSWIPADPSAPLSSAVVDYDNGTFLWSLNRKQVYEACIDSTLSYAVQKPNSSLGPSHVIRCEFSPLIGCRSYISCLTNHGLLQIYKNDLRKWIPVMNITQLWISHCSFKENNKKIDFNLFKSEMFKLKITTMKWVSEPEILFLTGHENGEIVLWKVEVVNNTFGMSVKNKYKSQEKPIYLHFCKAPHVKTCFLFFGTVSGTIKCVPVDLDSDISNNEFVLWKEKDLLTPTLIVAKYICDKLLVFSVKQHILLIHSFSIVKLNQLELQDTQWEEFATNIIGWNEFQESFILTLQNHDVYMLTLKNNDKNKVIYEKELIDMGVKKKNKGSYSSFGLSMSQNKAIWMLVSSPKQNYNSLKEITQVILYTPENKVFGPLTDNTSSGLIDKVIIKYKETQLNEIFDLLELKKIELLTGLSKFKDSYEISDDLPLLHQQLNLWEAKLKLFCNLTESDSVVPDLEFSVTRNRAKKVILNYQKCDSLSELQKKSLHVCEMFLMNTKEKEKSLDEVCDICRSESFCYDIRISSCSNLHKFPRCCLSLLPCETTPYAICRLCESVAMTNFVLEGDNRCPYCDGLLELDTRFRSA